MRPFGSKTTAPRGDSVHLGALRRLGTVVLVSVLSSTTSACYRYIEIPAVQPMTSERVEFHLNDVGRVQLQRTLGPGARTVEGRVSSQTAETYAVAVYRLTNIRGDSFTWSGEEVQLPAAGVESVMRRDLDTGRSLLAVASAAGAVAVFALSRSLLGGGRDSGESQPPPSQSIR